MHADIPVLFYIPMIGWPRIILPIVRCISSGCSSSICQSVTDLLRSWVVTYQVTTMLDSDHLVTLGPLIPSGWEVLWKSL